MFSGAGHHAQKPEFKRGINPVIKNLLYLISLQGGLFMSNRINYKERFDAFSKEIFEKKTDKKVKLLILMTSKRSLFSGYISSKTS